MTFAELKPQRIMVANNDRIPDNGGFNVENGNVVGFNQFGDFDGASPANGRDDIIVGGVIGNPIFAETFRAGANAQYNQQGINILTSQEIQANLISGFDVNIKEW